MQLGSRILGGQHQHLQTDLPQGRLIPRLPSTGRAWLVAGRVLFLFALLLPATVRSETTAAGDPVGKLVVEASLGREELSSPLIRVAEEGPLLFVDGLNRLTGNYGRINASGMVDREFGETARIALSAHLDVKRAPSAPDLDWGMASADLMLRRPTAGLVFGLGPTLQTMWLAGPRFRDTTGIQGDIVGAADDGHWALFGQVVGNRHPGDNRDLDSRVTLLTLQRRLDNPWPALDGIDLEVGYVRERNRQGFDDLSSRSAFLRAAVERKFADVTLSLGTMLQHAHFDATSLDDIPARRDRYATLDFAAEVDLGSGDYLKFEANAGNNRANVVLYDSRYRHLSLSVGRNW